MYKVVIYGHRGFLGQRIVDVLSKQDGFEVVKGDANCLNLPQMIEELTKEQPNAVVVSVGKKGVPASRWYDENPIDSIEGNLTTAINIVKATQQLGIRALVIGTAFVQSGTTSEDDPLNPEPNFYGWMSSLRERLFAKQPNTLLLRVNYPLTLDDDPNGLIAKIKKFTSVHQVKSSITVVDDLFQYIPKLLQSSTTGVLNFVNPGPLSPADIVEIFGWNIPINPDAHPVEHVQLTDKLESILGPLKSVKEILTEYAKSK